MHIYIEENEKIALPKKYRPVNNICAIIYDQLTEIYKRKNYSNLLSTDLKLDKKTQKLVKELQKDKIHILDWLKENELNDEITTVLTAPKTYAGDIKAFAKAVAPRKTVFLGKYITTLYI